MKYFNKLIVGIIIFWLLLAAISSYTFHRKESGGEGKEYIIDINRLYDKLSRETQYLEIEPNTQEIESNTQEIELNTQEIEPNSQAIEPNTQAIALIVQEIDLSQYTSVKDLHYLKQPSSAIEFQEFFDGKSIVKDMNYSIKPLFVQEEVVGYLRFLYSPIKEVDRNEMLIILNLSLGLMAAVIIIILCYIKQTVLKPFHEILDMPYELSKGHLRKGIKESKTRFFGRFLWGLDLLRENLEAHKRRELQLEKEKKTMILSISHDIKTPLSTIKLYAKAIYDNLYDTEEKRRNAAKHIEEKVDQIEGFVGEIIATSTEDLLDIQVNLGEVYLSELMKEIHKTYDEKLKLLMIEFSCEGYEDILLKGDIERLIEVFENIIENAIKYGDGKSIKISFADEDYCKLITVTNSGTPIPQTQFIHMFESFWRGANAHEKPGSGLGLYICKEIMSKMEGDIFVESINTSMEVIREEDKGKGKEKDIDVIEFADKSIDESMGITVVVRYCE